MDSVNNNQSSSVLGTTLVAGGFGATVGGIKHYLRQRQIITKPDEFINSAKKALTEATTNKQAPKIIEKLKNELTEMRLLRKTGELKWGFIAKKAGVASAIAGGIYLAYRAVKEILTSRTQV